MASRKFRLRIEPYDPDAIDADGDGIVQEGTAWERPGGTRIVDNFLNEISRGMTATSRSSQFRVVDRNGRPIRYTPTYQRGGQGAEFGGQPTKPISQLGPTLKERGLRPIGEGRTLNDRIEAARTAATSAASLRASEQEQAEIQQSVDRATQSLSLRRTVMLADIMTPEEAKFHNQIDLQAKQLLNAQNISAIDRPAVEALVLGGTYWATYLVGGGNLSGMLNDIATGIGDAGIQEQAGVLRDMLLIGGAVGLKAALSSATERFGLSRQKIDEFVDRFAERMRANGEKFRDMREDLAESIRNVVRELGGLMRMGLNPDSNKLSSEEIAAAASQNEKSLYHVRPLTVIEEGLS